MSIFDFKTLMSKLKAHLSVLFGSFRLFYQKLEAFLINLRPFIKISTQPNNLTTFSMN